MEKRNVFEHSNSPDPRPSTILVGRKEFDALTFLANADYGNHQDLVDAVRKLINSAW